MTIPIAIARGVVRVASWLVPQVRRDDWTEEWEGEIAACLDRTSRWRALGFALGAVPHAVAELREEWNVDALWREVRTAVRVHIRNPAYSLTAIVLIALGVGANATVFTLANAVLWRAPRGVEAPDRLVQIGRVGVSRLEPRDFDSWSYPQFVELRAKTRAFTDLAAYDTRDVTLGDAAAAERAVVQLVSGNYFRVLGAEPSRGRTFVADDELLGAQPVAVISDALWRRRLGSDPAIIGKPIGLRGRAVRVVGIAPSNFVGVDIGNARPDVWVPLGAIDVVAPRESSNIGNPGTSWLWVIGRLAPTYDVDAARTELRSVIRSMQTETFGNAGEDVAVAAGAGLRPGDRALATTIAVALFAMVVVVLLIACANLAALLHAHGSSRDAEIGVRLALGATRRRVVRQLLIETSVVAVVGSILAFVVTQCSARMIEWLLPYSVATRIQPDVRVLLFTIAIGVTASVAFAVAPAVQATRVDFHSLVRAGSVVFLTDRGRLRTALVVAQIALAFVLLGSAGVITRSVARAGRIDPGFRTDDVLVGEVDLEIGDDKSSGALLARLEQVVARAAATAGVLRVAVASNVPTSGTMASRFTYRVDRNGPDTHPVNVSTLVVDTGYFRTMDVPIVMGRSFDATTERPGSVTAVVVNETLAKRYWPNESPIGKAISFGSTSRVRPAVVIGVSRDTRNRPLRAAAAPQVYILHSQEPSGRGLLHVRVRPGDAFPARLLAAELRAITPGSAPIRFRPIQSWLAEGYADVRMMSILGGVFGVLALVLAIAGIHGVVSYETARRRREYGVRLALGATVSDIYTTVLGRGARATAVGIAIGLVAFAAAGPLLSRWLFATPVLDPLTLVSISAVLLVAAVAASLAAASRATGADPIDSLRA